MKLESWEVDPRTWHISGSTDAEGETSSRFHPYSISYKISRVLCLHALFSAALQSKRVNPYVAKWKLLMAGCMPCSIRVMASQILSDSHEVYHRSLACPGLILPFTWNWLQLTFLGMCLCFWIDLGNYYVSPLLHMIRYWILAHIQCQKILHEIDSTWKYLL